MRKIGEALDRTRAILKIPESHQIAILPGSNTGAFEALMWSMLGARGVDVLSWESFGKTWARDAAKELKLKDARYFDVGYGEAPDLSKPDPHNDIVFVYNGTTSGVCLPDTDWISGDRQGLTICDATSAAFALPLDWSRLDATTFSWQKAMGGEAGFAMAVLSPRAIERLTTFKPPRPMPKLFRLARDGAILDGLFDGATINTISMLCVEDYLLSLKWAASIGGRGELESRVRQNADIVFDWIAKTPWADFLCADAAFRSMTSVCLIFADKKLSKRGADAQKTFARKVALLLEREGAAFDILHYREAPPGLRIWCGPTVDASDLDALTPWIDWAYDAAWVEMFDDSRA